MSSVPQSKRALSNMEFYANAKYIRKKITFYILRDFGIKDKIRSLELFPKAKKISEEDKALIQELSEKYEMYNPLVEQYPRWYLDDTRNTCLSLCRSLIHNIKRANKINPRSVVEYEQRRAYQNNAIGDCECLLEEFQTALEIMPIDLNKYEEVIEKLDFEICLLEAWRKSDKRLLKGIIKKVSQQERGISEGE